METYTTFVVPMGNTKFTKELELQARNDSVTLNNKKEKSRDYLNNEETIKDSESTSENIKEEEDNLVA